MNEEESLQSPENLIRKSNSVVEINKPEGRYTIIYGFHNFRDKPGNLPENIDGLFLETGGGFSFPDNNYLANSPHVLDVFKKGSITDQYKDLFTVLEEKRTPIFFSDVNFTTPAAAWIGVLNVILPIGESALGTYLLYETGKNLLQRKVRRRDFLKLGVGAWLGLAAGETSRFASDITGRGINLTINLTKIAQTVHPESNFMIVTLRNAIIAYKQQWLMQQMEDSPHLATVIGGAHVGIEEQVQASLEDKLHFLQAVKPLIEKTVIPPYFYTVVKMDYDGQEWHEGERYEIPELKQLISSKT